MSGSVGFRPGYQPLAIPRAAGKLLSMGLDRGVEQVFKLQARRAGWRLLCLENAGRFCGFLLRAPDGAIGLYDMGGNDDRKQLHGDANPPETATVTEGWRVTGHFGTNFRAVWVVEAPGGQRLVFDNDRMRLPRSEPKARRVTNAPRV